MLTDYHTHTPLCHHATGAVREYVLAARAAGLAEIGISDHNPMPTQFDDWRMAPGDFDTYLGMVREAQQEFPDFPVRLGMECDFIPGYEGHIRDLAGRTDWDYLIGSVHYIANDWDVDSPFKMGRWKHQPVADTWRQYFDAYALMAQSGLFDFFAHPDLVKKFGLKPEGDLGPYYVKALDAIADHHGVIELNTAGLRKAAAEIYPSRQFLEMARARHIPVLINSDAHAPNEVGLGFDQALALVKEVGYGELVRFEKRKRKSVAI